MYTTLSLRKFLDEGGNPTVGPGPTYLLLERGQGSFYNIPQTVSAVGVPAVYLLY